MSNALTDAPVTYYRDSYDSTPVKTLRLIAALEAIRSGVYRSQVRTLRAVLASKGKRAYDRAKAQLPAFTFGGVFYPSRGNAHLVQHTGIVHGDLDHLDSVTAVKQAICGDPRTVYAFISPSGVGLKVGVHVPVVADDAAYKHAWQTVSAVYEVQYGGRWDPSGKDVSRLCFVSDDPDFYPNLDAAVFEVPEPDREPRPPAARSSFRRATADRHGYGERAILTAVQMIEAAELGTRHHIRLKAARLLGGYVAGGLLRQEQAYRALAQALVGHTDDLARALKTVEDGLTYGQAYPITSEDLEGERGAWLAQRHPRQDRERPLPSGVPTGGTPFPTTLARQSLQIRTIPGKAVPAWR
jgi:hypothetical protein